MIHYSDDWLTVYLGDCREQMATLPAESVHCVVTSPPYHGLRDYGQPGQIGLEATPEEWVEVMVGVMRGVRRVMRPDATCWLNVGDAFAEKQLLGLPWRLAFALQADGWYLRSDIIWAKPNPMPESVTDRPTKAHEYLFLLTKSPRYYYDADAVREPAMYGYSPSTANDWQQGQGGVEGQMVPPRGRRTVTPGDGTGGRNLRTVWNIATQPYPGAHFATFPEALVEPCIKAGTSERGVCPECGAPWVREVERTGGTYAQRKADGVGGPYNDAPELRRYSVNGSHMGELQVVTTGWRPGCQCGRIGTNTPATVLDPFAGSGTVGRVANRLSRRAILIDLSAEYLDQAMLRNNQSPLGLGA